MANTCISSATITLYSKHRPLTKTILPGEQEGRTVKGVADLVFRANVGTLEAIYVSVQADAYVQVAQAQYDFAPSPEHIRMLRTGTEIVRFYELPS